MVRADEFATSGVREKMKENHCICEDRGEAVPTFVIMVIKTSLEVVGIKGNNAKLIDHTNGLVMELDKSRVSKRFARDRAEKAKARVKTLKKQMGPSD